MLLTELRPEIEAGKTAALHIEIATYRMVLNLFVSKNDGVYTWRRTGTFAHIERVFFTWEELMSYLGGMSSRDETWAIEESIEKDGASQLISIDSRSSIEQKAG